MKDIQSFDLRTKYPINPQTEIREGENGLKTWRL